MDKLLVALCSFAFGSALALADDLDTKPVSKMTIEEAQAARFAAKAKWDAMTPEEKAAVENAIAKKRIADLTAVEAVARCAEHYDGPALTTPNCTPLIGDMPFDRPPQRGLPPTKAPSKAPGTTPQEQPGK